MLLAFELRFKWTEPFVKRYFGFMYSYWGRTIFLILCVTHAPRPPCIGCALRCPHHARLHTTLTSPRAYTHWLARAHTLS